MVGGMRNCIENITQRDMARLAVETGASISSIRRWAIDDEAISRALAYALNAASKKLKIVVERPEKVEVEKACG